jgi:hypothetical protein
MDKKLILGILIGFFVAILSLARCGTNNAKAASLSAQMFAGPGGTTCYAIMADGAAVGGNCQP